MTQSISPEIPLKLEEEEATPVLKICPLPSQSTQNATEVGKHTSWDEKGRSKLAQIFVSYSKDYIHSIVFQYIEDGKLVISPIFGCPNLNGPNFTAIMFTEARNNECITRLSGSYGTRDTKIGKGVTSLTIETNAATYGPFGYTEPKYNFNDSPGAKDTKFNLSFGPEYQFGGFHGTSSSDILTSIGVYVKPIDDLSILSKKTELHVQ